MKKFNFLSKSSSQSCGHSSVTLASTVCSPSAHRRGTMLKLISVLVLVLTFGVGNVWGTENETHVLTGTDGMGTTTTSTLLNNNAAIPECRIDVDYPIKQLVLNYRSNNANGKVNVAVSVGDTDWGNQNITSNTTKDLTFSYNGESASGTIIITFTNNSGSGTGKGTFYKNSITLTEGAPIPTYDVNWSIKGVIIDTENTNGKPTVPEDVADLAADETCNGKVFVGWTANPTNDGSRPSDLFTTQAGTAISAETTYEAVFADAEEGDPTWQKTTSIANNDVVIFVYESGTPAAPIKELTGVTTSGTTKGTATDVSTSVAASYTLTVEATTSNNVTKYAFKNSSNNYLSWSSGNSLTTSGNKTNASTWTISSSTDGNFKFANVGTTSRILQYNSGSPRWACYGNSDQSAFQIYKSAATIIYSNYTTTCCQPLAQINGSVNLSQEAEGSHAGELKATWQLEGTTGIGTLQMQLWKKGSPVTQVGDAADVTINASAQTKYYSGLDHCATYYVKLVATKDAGTYCTDGWTEQSNEVTTVGYSIATNPVGGGLSLSPNKSIACAGDVFTITANSPDGSHEGSATILVTDGESNDITTSVLSGSTLTMPSSDITITATYAEKTSPSVGVSVAALDFESPKKGAPVDAQTFSLTGSALTVGTLTLVAPSGYTVSPSSIEVASAGNLSAQTITVTPSTENAGTFNGNISISGAGVEETNIVALTMTVLETYTVNWYVNGTKVHEQTDVANTDYDEVPSDFSAFDDCKDGLTFIGWSETAFGSTTSAPSLANIGSAITAANKNYYAVFAEGTPGSTQWEKATSVAAGEYLIVYETGGVAFDGSLSTLDAVSNTIAVTISEGKIAHSDATEAAKFTIAAKTGGYSIKSASNQYIGQTSDANGLKQSETDEYTNTISISEGNADIVCSSAHLSYNSASNQTRFRYYKSTSYSDQKAIQLYKKNVTADNWTKWYTTCPHYYTISLTNDGIVEGKGSFVADKASALEEESVTLTATGTANAGRFNSWSITGLDSYSATTNPLTITMPDNDITVSATFDALYAITKDEQNGTITLGADYAAAGDNVTISASANPQYKNPVLTVFETGNESNTITVSAGAFTMPAYGVTARVVCEPAIEPLAAPVLGEATDATYQGVTLNWTGVAGNEGYVLTVQQGGVDVEGLVNVAIAQNATSYTIASGLAANTDYTYSIYTKGNGTTTMEVNTPANGNFSTEDYPAATLTLHDANGSSDFTGSHKLFDVVELPSTAAACSKTFMGWSANAECAVAPEIAKGANYTLNALSQDLYAVYADITGGGTSTTNIAHTSASTTNMTGGNDAATYFGLDGDDWSLVGAKGNNSNYPGLNNAGDIRLYSASGGGAIITITAPQTITSVGLTFTGASYNNAYVKVGGETVALSDGVYPINATSFEIGNANTSSTASQVRISNIAVNFTTSGTPSNYSTECAAAPEVIVNPEEIETTYEAVTAGVIEVAYDNVDETNIGVAMYNDAECSEAFDGSWLTASLNGDKNIAYTIAENTSYNDARSAYIKLTAPAEASGPADAVVIIPVTQAKKPAVFASLAELAAADVASGTEVTVTIDNRITDIYTNYYNYRYGIYLNVQKYNQEETPVLKDIEIYFNGEQVPASEPEWVIGGTVSGTIVCSWEYYSTDEIWELKPGEGWHWTDLTYNAPATVSSVTISGTTPDKTTYSVGEAFDPAGLTVHVEYSDESDADITASDDDWAYVTWNVDPATFAAEHIGTGKSVSVTATYSGVTSSATNISSLTINAIPVSSVSLNKNAATLREGKTVQLTATIEPSNATYKTVSWESDDTDVATVSETGLVTAVAAGSATITCKSTDDATKYATCAITVVESIDFSAGDWTLVTDIDELTEGSYVIIAAEDYDYAMISYASGNNCGRESAVKNGNMLNYKSEFAIFEIQNYVEDEVVIGKSLFDVTTEAYLYSASNSSNHMKAKTTQDKLTAWEFEITSGTFTAYNLQNGSYQIQYNKSGMFSCYTGTQEPIALYKYYAPVPKVTYDKNTEDEVTNMPNPSVQRAENNKAVIASGPSRTGYTFEGWKNGNTTYTVGEEYTFTEDITLYAQWTALPSFHVTYNTSGSQGTTPTDATDYYEGDEVTLASASGLSNAGYFFDQWVATYVDNNSETQTLVIEDGKFTMPAFNVTVTATWARKSSDKWIKVTATSQLAADKEYIIVNTDATYAVGAQGSNNRTAAAIEENNGILTISDAVAKFTLGIPEAGKYTFENGGKYLYASSDTKNYLHERAENSDANGIWTINIGEEGAATVTATGTNTRNIMRYNPNNGSPVFSCYASSSSVQNPVVLYYKAPKIEINDSESVNVSDAAGSDIVIHEGGILTVDASASIGDLTVEAGGQVVLDANKLTVVGTFTIETTMASGKSGQLNGATASNFEAQEDAYIDITLGDNGNPEKWHAFTVPFPVDAINGIYDLDGKKLANEVNYAIMDYHGDIRATGNYGWKKFRGIMTPGTFYLMTVDGLRTTYRFKKTANGALVAGNTKALTAYSGGGADTDQGWNGVGNPTMVYGTVDQKVQVLNPSTYTYEQFLVGAKNFVVGTPFFVQATTDGTMTMGAVDGEKPYYAPTRVQANEIKDIEVTFGNEEYSDRLYISASEDALNEYQIGKDLAKMTMTSTPKVAQIFGKAYNTKLCMVNAPMANDQAVYDLTLYAPKAGEYTIAAPAMENADLYLTYEGSIIWDLTMGAYTNNFAKGNNEGYGLLLQAKMPMTPTGIEDVQGDNVQCTKVVIDEHVYILRGGEMYDVTGKAVK